MKQESLPMNDITARLATTRDELAGVATALAAIPNRKESLLAAPDYSEQRLLTLEEEEVLLLKRHAHLSARIPLLQRQQEVDGATKAQMRIGQLVTESADRRREYDELLATFQHEADALRIAGEQLVAGFLALQSCHDEQNFLLARYEDFSLDRRPLTNVGTIPHEDDTADVVLRPLADFWRGQHGFGGKTPWAKQLHDLENDRHYQQQRESRVTIGGHVRQTIS